MFDRKTDEQGIALEHRASRRNMGVVITAIVLVVAALVFSPSSERSTDTESSEAEESTAPENLAIGETGNSGGIEVTVHGVVDPWEDFNPLFGPDDDERYLAVEVGFRNAERDTESSVNTRIETELRDTDGRKYDIVRTGGDSVSGNMRLGDVLRGNQVFAVPADVPRDELEFRYSYGLFRRATIVFDLGRSVSE